MDKMTDVQAPGRLQALDGWRTVSIAGVIIAHLLTQSNIRVPLEVFGPAAGFVQQMGLAGVHIFFVISGFVICRGMLREEQRNGRVSLSAFYVRRVMRIMPPLMLYAGVVIALALLGVIGSEHLPIWRALTFTCNLPGADCGGFLGAHTWSLSYEEQFYLIAPPLFVIASTARRGRGVWLLIALVAVAVAASFAGLMTAATFLSNFFFILTGVVCALHEETVVKALRRLPPGSFWVFVAAFLAFERLGITRFSVPAAALCSVAIAGMLMMTAFGLTRVGSWLATAPMVSIGRVSYGVYLWQQLATFAFPGAGMAFYAASVAGCIGISYLSFFLMERPLIAVGATWSDRIIARHANRGQQA